MPQAYRGDIGKFRRALNNSGFEYNQFYRTIYNDDRKTKPKLPGRRLKLWNAGDVFNASQAAQRKLERNLRKEFGDRIIKMYFTEGFWMRKQLCIKLNS